MATWTILLCCTFVLSEYQKINSSAIPVIFISFKIINEQINFRRQQLSRGTENCN